jgi:hypothetical protein
MLLRLIALPPVAAWLLSGQAPARTCESLLSVTLLNTTIDSATAANGVCRVDATVTHPPAGDKVRIYIALPLEKWNGRFQGTGGGGFSGGSPNSLAGPSSQGFATASTNTGHDGGSGSFALDADGRLDWMLIRDNAYLGIHEMTVAAKALVEAFYGKPPQYSYFNGCSTGGRQGLMEAQRYPADYHGILSGAPAINWTKLHVAQAWGQMAMAEANHYVSSCKFAAANAAAITACDMLDGVKDGLLEDPSRCKFDPKILTLFQPADCERVTDADAAIIRKIWDGPKRSDGSFLWYGLPRGADFGGLNATGGSPLTGRPSGITMDWWRYFLKQDPKWTWTGGVTQSQFEQMWDQSVEEFGPVIATDNPDLTAFRDRGGKLILWHGWADPVIFAQGTIDYYSRVLVRMGAEATPQFIRLFMAPGVAHCRGGSGPEPTGQFEALMKWVEQGIAPETLLGSKKDAAGATRTRPLCQYPLAARYRGSGSIDTAASFTCAAGF